MGIVKRVMLIKRSNGGHRFDSCTIEGIDDHAKLFGFEMPLKLSESNGPTNLNSLNTQNLIKMPIFFWLVTNNYNDDLEPFLNSLRETS